MTLDQIRNSPIGHLNQAQIEAPIVPVAPTVQAKHDRQANKAERDLHYQAVTWLEQHRGIIVGHGRMDKPSTFTLGWPDLTFAIEGQPFAIELKTADGALSEDQVRVIDWMRRNGWRVGVCRSLPEVREFIDGTP